MTLSWDVAGADTVLLRYPGGEEQLPAQGSKAMSPQQTMTYVLFAASAAGHNEAALAMDVAAVFSAPTADLAAAQAPLPGRPRRKHGRRAAACGDGRSDLAADGRAADRCAAAHRRSTAEAAVAFPPV